MAKMSPEKLSYSRSKDSRTLKVTQCLIKSVKGVIYPVKDRQRKDIALNTTIKMLKYRVQVDKLLDL